MAYLARLSNGQYYARVRISVSGKITDKFLPLKTKSGKRANLIFPRILEREKLFKAGVISLAEIVKTDFPVIANLVTDYLENCEREGLNDRTIQLYQYGLNLFAKCINGRDIACLTDADGDQFTDYLRGLYSNRQSANIHLRTVNHFLNFLVKRRKIAALPFRLKQFRVEQKSPRYFSNEEMNRIFKAARDNQELAYRIFVHYNTGLRLNELDRSELKGRRIAVLNPCKRGAIHYIPVNDRVAKAFLWLKENCRYHPRSISRAFKELLEALKLYRTADGKCRHFHHLRDTFGTAAYYLTRDIFQVAKWMGHISKKSGVPNVETTAIYANFDDEQLIEDFGNRPETLSDLREALLRNYATNHLARIERLETMNILQNQPVIIGNEN